MRHLFPPRFENLEARKLLSKLQVAVAHGQAADATSTPLSLNGTLSVDAKASTMLQNEDGSSTTTTPVSGRLDGLGAVHGVWNESTNQFGSPTGNDTVRLHNSQGSVVILFSPQNTGPGVATGKGTVSYPRAQRIVDVPGAYADASERGTVDLITNRTKSSIATMVLTTQN